ncbi:amino acid adenylation domain-containing protein [Brevibacillus laterosporus]|uniref:non-ribosomal peptide synthetase n=1 Tax=Brevibacillus laterosporus TaxID=1465 RepID=UPI00112CFE74|nr:non-ribosomal peptide synthetase [Brevibacillus laterosporus]MBG9803130.1 gramicidin synthetase [Brevibacillus laterosporus]MED4765532.1 amino acid adenylation domain-containing protein [Brevibacillus laterosporus]TPH11781.1 amino acid adenylation domain-containing protein [Brevibacillus laterosporus]
MQKTYALSNPQKRIWYTEMMHPDTAVNIMAGFIKITGQSDYAKLCQAINAAIYAHDALRIRLTDEGQAEPRQYLLNYQERQFPVIDYSKKVAHPKHEDVSVAQEYEQKSIINKVVEWAESQTKIPMELFHSDLYDISIHLIDDEQMWVYCRFHHLIADGVSIDMFCNQFMDNYVHLLAGESIELEVQPSYLSYLDSEMEYEASVRFQKDKSYWQEAFSSLPEVNGIKQVPTYQSSTLAARESVPISKRLQALVHTFCKEYQVSVNALFLATLSIYLQKLTFSEDITIGTLYGNRTNRTDASMFGMFVSTQPFRTQVNTQLDFVSYVRQITQKQVSILRHQKYPYNLLMQELRTKHRGMDELFTIVLEYQPMKWGEKGQLTYSMEWLFSGHVGYPLYVHVKENIDSGQMMLTLDYQVEMFDKSEIIRVAEQLLLLLQNGVEEPSKKVGELQLLSGQERQLLLSFNETQNDFPLDKTVHQMFEEQVEKTPEHTAVIFENKHLTYRELNEQANRLARRLRQKGVQPDQPVAMLTERSLEMLIGIFAIMKAGGAYLPIDPEFPNERMEYMVQDSGAFLLLVHPSFAGHFSFEGEEIIIQSDLYADEDGTNLKPLAQAHHLAYVIYTSGSTGNPKGVMIEHRSVISRNYWSQRKYPLTEQDTILQKTPYTFDVSVYELFGWSFVGAKVCFLQPGAEKDPGMIVQTIQQHHISIIHFVPSMLHIFLTYLAETGIAEQVKNLRLIFASGEALKAQHVAKFHDILQPYGISLHNLYGPTETTIQVTYYDCDTATVPFVLIGRPVDNVHIYIVGPHGEQQPMGVTGELCVSGVGLARGYLNLPEMTASRFVPNPFTDKEELMYKTGDYARWLPNGQLEYLGRMDHQVKIRGYRIESEEIETQLVKIAGVKDAVVVAVENEQGDQELCAYIVTEREHSIGALREKLANALPTYMIPTYFIPVQSMPLTQNGKVDRKSLPLPTRDADTLGTDEVYIEPKNEREWLLAKIWEAVLRVERVGARDNFFYLGGDSIKAIQVMSRLRARGMSLEMKRLFQFPILSDAARGITLLEQKIESRLHKATAPLLTIPMEELPFLQSQVEEDIPMGDIEQVYPLTPSQEWMYVHSSLNQPASFFIQLELTVKGQVDVDLLAASLQRVVERHDALRTVYRYTQREEIVQCVLKNRYIPVLQADISHLDEQDQHRFLQNQRLTDRERGFDLTQDVMRLAVVTLATSCYHIMVSTHHIQIDGWSLQIMLQEWMEQYRTMIHKTSVEVEDAVPFYTYMKWIEQQDQEESLRFWRQYLQGYEESTALPKMLGVGLQKEEMGIHPEIDYRQESMEDEQAETILYIEKHLTSQLQRIAKENHSTTGAMLQTAWGILLGKYNGRRDAVFGRTVSGRPSEVEGVERIMGLFINTNPLRVSWDEQSTFLELLKRVSKQAVEAKPYEYCSFSEIQALSPVKQGLIDHLFIYQNYPLDVEGLVQTTQSLGYTMDLYAYFEQTHYDFTVKVTPEDSLQFHFIYNRKRYDEKYVKCLMEHFITLLHGIVENSNQLIDQLELISTKDKRVILERFNDSKVKFPKDKTFTQLFEEQVIATSNKSAIVWGDQTICYWDLNKRANQLARTLREKGVLAESIVGILMDRSIEMFISVLAVLKAGGAYVPIDPHYPSERIYYLLTDSDSMMLLTTRATEAHLQINKGEYTKEILYVEDELNYHSDGSNLVGVTKPENMAYLIYTSGSTGKPKGVMIEHRGYVNAAYAWMQEYELKQTPCRLLQMASFSFDVFAGDMAKALLTGGQLIICPEDIRIHSPALYEFMRKHQISMVDTTPALFVPIMQYVAEEGLELPDLKLILLGADTVSIKDFTYLLHKFGQAIRILNTYGVTEASIESSYFEEEAGWLNGQSHVPIGKPLPNTSYYIVNQQNQLLPVGIPGELCIGGAGVARGYYKQEELTLQKFIPNPYVSGERMYKTGDVARWLPDGNVAFLGRMDHQVKVRGYRIETGEIEAKIRGLGYVKEAVVSVWTSSLGEHELCAHLVSDEGLSFAKVKDDLATFLPGYMIPTHMYQIDQIPLTPNGKVDRKTLSISERNAVRNQEYVAPRNQLEARLAMMWQDLLGISPVSIYDDFFELGGHSLKVMMFVAKVHKEWHVQLPIEKVFQYPTIASLAKLLPEMEKSVHKGIQPAQECEYYPLSSSQKRLFLLHQLDGATVSYNILAVIMLEGAVDRERMEIAFQHLIQRHATLRTSFELVHGEPIQRVHDKADFTIQYEDMRNNHVAEEDIHALIQACIQPFDLETPPLLRVGLIELAADRHLLLVDIHHIISDAVSMATFTDEFVRLYQGDELPALLLQYKDYAVWQQSWKQTAPYLKQEEYWLQQLAGELPVLQLPLDYQRPEALTFSGDQLSITLDQETTHLVHQIAEETGTTPFMVLLSTLGLLLAQYSGQDEIMIGSPIAGRRDDDIQRIIGMFVNTLVLRMHPEGSKSFTAYLDEVKLTSLKAFENQDYQFEELIEKVKAERVPNRNPLFDVVFVLQNTDWQTSQVNGLTLIPYPYTHQTAKFDLTLQAMEQGDRFHFTWEYRTALFKRDTIEQMGQNYVELLRMVTANKDMLINEIPFLRTKKMESAITEDFTFTF